MILSHSQIKKLKAKYYAEGVKLAKKRMLVENIQDDEYDDGYNTVPFVVGDINEGDVIMTKLSDGDKIIALVTKVTPTSSSSKYKGKPLIGDLFCRELPYGSLIRFEELRSRQLSDKDQMQVIKPEEFDTLTPQVQQSIEKVEAMINPSKGY